MIEPDVSLEIPFDLILPPKRHETEYRAFSGKVIVARHAHAVLPEPFIDLVNSATQEDFQLLMKEQWKSLHYRSSPRSQS